MKKIFVVTIIVNFLFLNIKTIADQQKFVLMTTLYNEKNKERQQEYIDCLQYNLAHPSIKHIHVLYDTSDDDKNNTILAFLKENKIPINYLSGRATFGDFFTIAKKVYPEECIIISNADIFFDKTLEQLETFNFANIFLALTRWNMGKNDSLKLAYSRWDKEKKQLIPTSHFGYSGCLSSDVWIFKNPLKQFEHDDIALGFAWCDACIVYQAYQAGLTVINPCLTIKCYHLHKSGVRHWTMSPTPQKNYPALSLPFTFLERN